MTYLLALLSGLVFGAGLVISGMTNPLKVQNFLDVSGLWDPSLAFVMGGAVVVSALGFAMLRRAEKPLFALKFQWPGRTDIDMPLVGGAALFGIGWGLVGLCPGPAVTASATLDGSVLLFVVAMLAGMLAAKWRQQRLSQSRMSSSLAENAER